jgi:hypothetical protein
MEEFYIYENWQAGPHKAVVHRSTCGFCNDGHGRAGGYDPRHALWHGPYVGLEAARHASDGLPNIILRVEHRCIAPSPRT